jgi:CBS-domain-containing membrane protein
MRLLDDKFPTNKRIYFLQCGLATLSVFTVLMILDAISNAAIIAALGASSFIAFTMPQAQVSRPRFLIGGYLVGTAAGSLCHFLSLSPWLAGLPFVESHPQVVFGAVAVGVAMFVMVVTDTEHPPAAGLALGFVLNEFDHMAVVVTLVGIVLVSIIKAMLKPVLKNLI